MLMCWRHKKPREPLERTLILEAASAARPFVISQWRRIGTPTSVHWADAGGTTLWPVTCSPECIRSNGKSLAL